MSDPVDPFFITLTGHLLDDALAVPDSYAAGQFGSVVVALYGNVGADTLTAYSGPSDWPSFATGPLEATETLAVSNYLSGGYGDDVLIAGQDLPGLTATQFANYARHDTLDGWKGDDTYRVSDMNVTIQDAWGNNTLVLTADFAQNTGLSQIALDSFAHFTANDLQNITLEGAADFDIRGDGQHNFLRGNDGRNQIEGFGGDDHLFGGAGNDFLAASGNTLQVGGAGNDLLRGFEGDNTLRGGSGGDTLIGDGGNDMLYGGQRHDHMYGLQGDDFYEVTTAHDVAQENLDFGFDTVASAQISLDAADFANFEKLMLTGSKALNLIGGGTVVELSGNDAANILTAGSGATTLLGNGGDDTIHGGIADDLIDGGTGADLLTGGLGHDVFRFSDMPDAATHDAITDFVMGEDVIDLTALGIVQFLADGFDGAGTASVTTSTGTALIDGVATTALIVSGDTDGDGTADFSFYLDNSAGYTGLAASDFLLYNPI